MNSTIHQHPPHAAMLRKLRRPQHKPPAGHHGPGFGYFGKHLFRALPNPSSTAAKPTRLALRAPAGQASFRHLEMPADNLLDQRPASGDKIARAQEELYAEASGDEDSRSQDGKQDDNEGGHGGDGNNGDGDSGSGQHGEGRESGDQHGSRGSLGGGSLHLRALGHAQIRAAARANGSAGSCVQALASVLIHSAACRPAPGQPGGTALALGALAVFIESVDVDEPVQLSSIKQALDAQAPLLRQARAASAAARASDPGAAPQHWALLPLRLLAGVTPRTSNQRQLAVQRLRSAAQWPQWQIGRQAGPAVPGHSVQRPAVPGRAGS